MTELELAAMVFADSFKLSKLYLPEDFKTAFVESFEAGAEWQAKQSPWISVEERLPEESLINPSAWSVTYKVFVLTSNGNASISQRRWNCNMNRWEWKGSRSFKDSITHWMPIPEYP